MIFVRTGPRILFLETEKKEELRSELVQLLGGKEIDFAGALEESGESDTIVIVVPPKGENIVTGTDPVVFIPLGSSVTLTEIINNGMAQKLSRAVMGPGLLLQRLPEGGSGVVNIIRQEYNAKVMEYAEAIVKGGPHNTVIAFSKIPLRRHVHISDLMENALLVNKPVPKVYRELRREAVRYYTEALEKQQWYELRINIYDADDFYKIHYERLALVLADLETGFILGESWTKDHALALLSVTAYQVRLFTTLEPVELKKILVGLEYDAEGKRFVDMDLYYRRHKISWSDVAKKITPEKKSGRYYREELYTKLSPDTLDKLLGLEQSIKNES